jgi:uncharacterized protein YggE
MKSLLFALAAVLCISFGTARAQTIVINAYGTHSVDPDKTVLEITLADYYFAEEGMTRPVEYSMPKIESDFFALLKEMSIPEKSCVFVTSEQMPSMDGYTETYTVRKYTLTIEDSKKYTDFTTRIYNVYGASYIVKEITVDDVEGLMKAAYSKAFADARQRSERMAALSGLKLGALISIEDLSAPYYPPSAMYYYEGEFSGANQCSFTANLKMTYAVIK